MTVHWIKSDFEDFNSETKFESGFQFTHAHAFHYCIMRKYNRKSHPMSPCCFDLLIKFPEQEQHQIFKNKAFD